MRVPPTASIRRRIALAAALASVATAAPALAQRVDAAAYARADRIRTFDPQLVGGRVVPVWLADSVRFYFVAAGAGADRGTYYLVDPRAGTRRPLFDAGRVAAALSARADTTLDAHALPAGRLADGEHAMLFDVRGRTFACALATATCALASVADVGEGRAPEWSSRSPDGQWDAFVWNYNLYVRPARLTNADPSAYQPVPRLGFRLGCDATAVAGPPPPRDSMPLPAGSVAITTDGTTEWGYGLYYFGLEVGHVAASQFRLASAGLKWSPDSKRLIARRDDLRGVRTYPLYSSTSNQPLDHHYFYAAPGDSLVPRFQFVVVDPTRRTTATVQVPPIGELGSPGEARWGRTADDLFVMSSARGSKSITLSKVDATTGATRTLIRDTTSTFIDFDDASWSVVNNGEDVLWLSERDGWAHLYRYGKDGTLQNQITRGQFVVAGITRVDSVAHEVYFTAWGKTPGIPYYPQLYRVRFDGTGLTALTTDVGFHSIRFTPKAAYFLDTRETIDTPPITTLRAADGRAVVELSRGDVTGLRATGWTPAESFTVKARDGETDLWGIIHRPSNFDPTRKYPIVTNVYPGPQIGSVRDWVFKGADSRDGVGIPGGSLGNRPRVYSGDGMSRALAELGFIVIQLDALGSSRRSKAFHDAFYGRVADNGLLDQMAAIRQLATRFPYIDTTRVGVWGHSGGGFSAAAAMFHQPDFFKVGVAQSGNHDFRVYGWYWGEKYQGLYAKSGATDNYEAEANYKYVENLKGKLLLMSGDMDCNNPPAETLRVVDALIKAGKDFDMLLVPDHGHQLPSYATKRSWDYFVRYLMGAEPPSGYRMLAP